MGGQTANHTSPGHDGGAPGWSASVGACGGLCSSIYPFAVVMFIMCMLGSVARVPITVVQLRYARHLYHLQ